LLLAVCKNWSGKCGRDEFDLFKTKLVNRVMGVGCGFLVSWNGFAEPKKCFAAPPATSSS